MTIDGGGSRLRKKRYAVVRLAVLGCPIKTTIIADKRTEVLHITRVVGEHTGCDLKVALGIIIVLIATESITQSTFCERQQTAEDCTDYSYKRNTPPSKRTNSFCGTRCCTSCHVNSCFSNTGLSILYGSYLTFYNQLLLRVCHKRVVELRHYPLSEFLLHVFASKVNEWVYHTLGSILYRLALIGQSLAQGRAVFLYRLIPLHLGFGCGFSLGCYRIHDSFVSISNLPCCCNLLFVGGSMFLYILIIFLCKVELQF